jgi:hypothetical protein
MAIGLLNFRTRRGSIFWFDLPNLSSDAESPPLHPSIGDNQHEHQPHCRTVHDLTPERVNQGGEFALLADRWLSSFWARRKVTIWRKFSRLGPVRPFYL